MLFEVVTPALKNRSSGRTKATLTLVDMVREAAGFPKE